MYFGLCPHLPARTPESVVLSKVLREARSVFCANIWSLTLVPDGTPKPLAIS